jgi:hypothetical protein
MFYVIILILLNTAIVSLLHLILIEIKRIVKKLGNGQASDLNLSAGKPEPK